MNFRDACQVLGLSRSTFQRKIKSGEIKATKVGEGQFAPLEFDPADLGVPPAQPKEPLAVNLSPDLPKGDTAVPPENAAQIAAQLADGGPTIEALDDWGSEELEVGVALWRLPADPRHGVVTNQPHAHSSNQPSCENFMRYTRALAILADRRLRGLASATPGKGTRCYQTRG
jgi:excisionase family DNA binding protein